jgi:hypothetical protein
VVKAQQLVNNCCGLATSSEGTLNLCKMKGRKPHGNNIRTWFLSVEFDIQFSVSFWWHYDESTWLYLRWPKRSNLLPCLCFADRLSLYILVKNTKWILKTMKSNFLDLLVFVVVYHLFVTVISDDKSLELSRSFRCQPRFMTILSQVSSNCIFMCYFLNSFFREPHGNLE